MSRELNKIKKRHEEIVAEVDHLVDEKIKKDEAADEHLGQISAEFDRVAEIYRAPTVIIKDIDEQFKKATKLDGMDLAFLFLATTLQVLRQYLVKFVPPERLPDQEAAAAVKDDKEVSNRQHRLYCPSLEEIVTNPVPFDANFGSDGFLSDFGKLGHRGATPGHDPIVGLVVGTANIATSTITNWKWNSRHVYTSTYGNTLGLHEVIKTNAKTPLIFSHTYDKIAHQGLRGKEVVGASLVKEIIHLKSDINTKDSLPLPFISLYDPELAGELAKRGFDMANVAAYTKHAAKQAGYAILINTLVAVIHGLFYDESMGTSRPIYEVRTRKILSYSNAIATTSNVVVTAVTKDMTKLDIGGMLVTLYRIASDTRFIREIKRDFLKNELADRIRGSEYDFMEE